MFKDTERPGPALSATDFHVLLVLASGDRYGYSIQKAVEDESQGAVRPQIGSLYRVIARLMSAGFVKEVSSSKETPDHPGRPRRYYRLTGSGRRALENEANRLRKALATAETRLPGARPGS